MADIFFTYAADDSARVAEIAKALEAQGLSVDWAREILPGQNRVTEMTRRLSEARAVVVVWSNRSVAAPMVLDEAGAARDQGKLVPVMIDRVEPPLGFRQLHTSDLTSAAAGEQLALLAQALKARDAGGGGATQSTGPGWGASSAGIAEVAKPAPGKFLWTRGFWSGTGLLALVVGLIWFLTPDSEAEMGAESAERFGYLIGVTLGAAFFILIGRTLTHLSRTLVGKGTRRYFDREFIVILIASVLFGFALSATPDQPGQESGAVVDTLSGVVVGPILAGIVLLAVRGILRLARGNRA